MSARCELGWNAGVLFGALDGDSAERAEALAHAATCPSCRATARMRARAKEAWTAAIRIDDAEERLLSEARLERAWPRAPRTSPARTIGFALAFAAAACAAGVAIGLRAGSPSPSSQSASVATSVPAANATSVATALPLTTPAALPSARSSSRIVAMSPCSGCRAGAGALEPGMHVGEAVVVPAGARLTLGFAFGDGFVDPSSGADVEGPARARPASAGATFALDRGTARVRGPGEITVEVPGARLATKGATYTLMVDDRGGAHLAVETGRVVVTMPSSREPITLERGGVLDIPPPSARTEAPAASAPIAPTAATRVEPAVAVASDQDSLAAARARFKGGDAEGAKESLGKLTSSGDATVARRASFTLAEIELATGQRDAARTRLDTLLTSPEEGLAADAATLLARSFTSADERASAWERYLATRPRSPFRERAMLERCEALLDAHHPFEANKLLAELRAATLTPSQTSQLERLSFKAREVR